MLCYETLLINLNSILTNSDNIKILCMIIKLKFTKPEVEVHITRTSYIGYQYFVCDAGIEELVCARNSSTSICRLYYFFTSLVTQLWKAGITAAFLITLSFCY